MDCILNTTEREELLLGFCTASLDFDTVRTFERHMKSCEDCRSLVEMHKLVDESLTDWEAPPPSSDFDRKFFARIRLEQDQATPWWRQYLTLQFGWKPMIPIALAAVLLIAFLVRTPDNNQQAEAIPADQIEQVERALDDMEALQALHQPDPAEAKTPTQKETL